MKFMQFLKLNPTEEYMLDPKKIINSIVMLNNKEAISKDYPGIIKLDKIISHSWIDPFPILELYPDELHNDIFNFFETTSDDINFFNYSKG